MSHRYASIVLAVTAAAFAFGCSEAEKENMRRTNDGTEDFKFKVDPKKHPWAAQKPEERVQPSPPLQAPESGSRAENGNELGSFKYEPDPNKHPWVRKGSKQ